MRAPPPTTGGPLPTSASKNETVIDLRSDTTTRPSPGMREAIASAEVGDEQKREDPTVNLLERRTAELLGHEEAVYLPTATMANEIAVRLHSEPGDELLAEEYSHILVAELGGPAVFSGLLTRPLVGEAGRISVEQIRAAANPILDVHTPRTRVVSIENTHNSAGGRVWPLEEIDAVVDCCRELDLKLHLDGARLFNAAIALGVPPTRISTRADTVTICLSKGLGCPLGALVAGSAELMVRARRLKHMFGGAMRQAGIVAAAGVYALEHNVERLAEDHARARRLAEGLAAAGLPVEPDEVETNFVQIDVAPLGLSKPDALELAHQAGVGISGTVHPTRLRAVTHLDVDDNDIEQAIELLPRALQGADLAAPIKRGRAGLAGAAE
jgi:threonine aldolase